jgi:hypothetical protein
MSGYVNTEEMRRAAGTFSSAVDDFSRLVGTFSEYVHILLPVLGSGYGNPIESLTAELQVFNNKPTGNTQKYAVIEKYSINIKSTILCKTCYKILDANNNSVQIGADKMFESELDAYKYANKSGYLIK